MTKFTAVYHQVDGKMVTYEGDEPIDGSPRDWFMEFENLSDYNVPPGMDPVEDAMYRLVLAESFLVNIGEWYYVPERLLVMGGQQIPRISLLLSMVDKGYLDMVIGKEAPDPRDEIRFYRPNPSGLRQEILTDKDLY